MLYTGTTVSDYVNGSGPRMSGLEYQWRWSPSPQTELWLGQAFTRVQWPNAVVGRAPGRASTVAVFHELPNRLKLGLVLAERRPMSWLGVGYMPRALRQADVHLSYPMRVGGANARASLTVRNLNGAKPLFESRFANPLSRRLAYASLDVEF